MIVGAVIAVLHWLNEKCTIAMWVVSAMTVFKGAYQFEHKFKENYIDGKSCFSTGKNAFNDFNKFEKIRPGNE